MYEILHYVTSARSVPFQEWYLNLNDLHAKARISARLDRIRLGNLGDAKSIGGGLCELRIDYGPGYRIYFAIVGLRIVLLLCGGDKHRQSADIALAMRYLQDYRKRSEKHEK